MPDHLKLPIYEGEFERKKKGGGRGPKGRENRKQFSDIQVFNLGEIKNKFDEDKKAFSQFFDPNLIFKIKLSQTVDENKFIKFLETNNIKVISPSPEGTGYWITLAYNENLDEVKNKLREYGKSNNYKDKFDPIEVFESIPPEEKIGEQLKKIPLQEDEEAYLDIEIWRMENSILEKFLAGFKTFINSKNGKITDELKTHNLCLLRVKINKAIFAEILKLREINRIDRPPKPYITYEMLSTPLENIETGEIPPKNATAIAILDSGILSNHPLLEKAVGDEIALPFLSTGKIQENKPQDDVGHGTKVAGIALYGDIKQCIEDKEFHPEIWILSAKVMFKNENAETGEISAAFDDSELLEHQMVEAIEYFTTNYPNCRVVNISFGDGYKKMFGDTRQFSLATLLDEIASERDIIFVVSSGNIDNHELFNVFPDKYPDYLIEENKYVKIIDPATSAYAITVGSIGQEYGPKGIQRTLYFSPAKTDYPSPFTCVGPGYKGMIKPELVEEGGNIIFPPNYPKKQEDIGGNLIVLNPKWIEDAKLFSVGFGTSFSAPKVAHFFAKLCNHFPDYSSNMIKALLITSARIPSDRPESLKKIKFNDPDIKLIDLLKIYGYGKPDFKSSISSDSNHVLLINEEKIKLDGLHLYYFYIPREFIETDGKKEISVVLVYNPPIRKNRIDYMGVNMEFHLFKNTEIQDVLSGYENIQLSEDLEEIIPQKLIKKEIDLHPGVRTRKRGIHQKGIKVYTESPGIEPEKPLVLAILSQSRWLKDKDYLQNYSIVVTIKHEARIDLYNRIKQQIQTRIRIK